MEYRRIRPLAHHLRRLLFAMLTITIGPNLCISSARGQTPEGMRGAPSRQSANEAPGGGRVLNQPSPRSESLGDPNRPTHAFQTAPITLPLDLDLLTDLCEHGAVGDIVGVESYWNDEHTKIFTNIDLKVADDFKGNAGGSGAILTLTELGGTVGNTTLLAEHAPAFNVGEHVLVFTERTPGGRLITLGRRQGKKTLVPAPGLVLDADGNRLGVGTVTEQGTITYVEPGCNLQADVAQLMAARGFTPFLSEGQPQTGDSHGVGHENVEPWEIGVSVSPETPIGDAPIEATEIPADVPWGGFLTADAEGRDDRACTGTLMYSNTGGSTIYAAGAGVPLSDDLHLSPGSSSYQLDCYNLDVFSPGGAAYDVTAGLYTACPGDGGTLILGTSATWNSIPVGGLYTLELTLGTPAIIPNDPWMVVTCSTNEAAWVVGGIPEKGWSNDRFGRGTGCGYWFGGFPTAAYSAFRVNLYTTAAVNCGSDVQTGSLNAISSSSLYPLGGDTFSRSTSIIQRGEIGCTASTDITRLAVYVNTAGTRTFSDFQIGMQTTTSTTVPAAWSAGTTVYSSSSLTFDTTGWHVFTLSTPFDWSADNLLISFQGQRSSGTDPEFGVSYAYFTTAQRYASDPSSFPTSLSSTAPNGARTMYQLTFDVGAAPTITDVSPDHAAAGVGAAGPSGSLITVTGTNFGTKGANDHMAFWQEDTNYLFNDSYIVSWTDTEIQCYVPAGASSKDCAVYKAGAWSNHYAFTVDWSYWYRWQDQSVMPIAYYMNSAGTTDVTDEFTVAPAAVQVWEDASDTYLDHHYAGTTALTATNQDGSNVISWTETGWSHGAGVIGLTTVWITGEIILETDMELNGEDFTYTNGQVAGLVDVASVVAHEAGHGFVGLNDVYGVADQEKTMYGVLDVTNGDIKKRTLEPEDIAGTQWIYPWAGQPIDDCSDATPVALTLSTPFTWTGKNSGATLDCGSLGTPEAWLAFTTSQCGRFELEYCGTTAAHGSVYTVLTVDCPCSAPVNADAWEFSSCGDDNGTIVWDYLPAGTYYYPILNDTSSAGIYSITGELTPADPVAPTSAAVNRVDFCANDTGTIDLSVSGGAGETVRWFTGSCGGTDLGTGNPLTIDSPTVATTYYARWENPCGATSCATVAVDLDIIGPSFTSIPSDIDVYADAGTCEAADIDVGLATATDDHNGVSSVVATRSDAQPLAAPYPVGTTTITWTATDGCGNMTLDSTQTVYVRDKNQLVIDLELEHLMAGTLTQCITYELRDYSCTSHVFQDTVTFVDGVATPAAYEVPCGDYQCIIVQDGLHSLTRRLDRNVGLDVVSNQYAADCTDANLLINGDFYDDDLVDIVDFGVYIAQWGSAYGSVTCSTTPPHADANGDGVLDISDFNAVSGAFLSSGDGACCLREGYAAPRVSITIAELDDLGLGMVARADLNADGLLDIADVALFLNGVTPDAPDPNRPRREQAGLNRNPQRGG